MKKRILLCAISMLCSSAYAVLPGFYLGMMFGPATNSGETRQAQLMNVPATVEATPRSTQYGSSLLLGYKVNQYAGSEFGFTYYSGIDYDTKDLQTCSSANTRVRDLHALFRGSFPLGTSFDVFGKAGVALVYQTTSGALNPDFSQECGDSKVSNKPSGSFALGVSYDLSQNWVSDVSVNTLLAGGAAGNVTWYALGITYHFVDTYCGQFLC